MALAGQVASLVYYSAFVANFYFKKTFQVLLTRFSFYYQVNAYITKVNLSLLDKCQIKFGG